MAVTKLVQENQVTYSLVFIKIRTNFHLKLLNKNRRDWLRLFNNVYWCPCLTRVITGIIPLIEIKTSYIGIPKRLIQQSCVEFSIGLV